MSSVIFYRFKSQKDTGRIFFDGTGLTVFDLKREIIYENNLGDGTDFQLKLFSPDTDEEYEDDAFVIPRSSSLIVRRSPAIKAVSVHSRNKTGSLAGIGNATRYVTGKPRVYQHKSSTMDGSGATGGAGAGAVSGTTEEERIASMFANQENQWEQTQQEMSAATPVFFKNNGPGSSMENEGPPPPGYMCYRCGGRDHWIKSCPTNADPNFEGKRIRRTTGIPKKFLKSIEIDPDSMTPEEMAQRKIMVTDEGKFVVQVADEHSWEDYQRKQQNRSINGNEKLWQSGHFSDLPDELKCPITGGLLQDPVTTTKCCQTDFSKRALEDALVESDFVCPKCDTQDILLDSLVINKDKKEEVDKFLKTHEGKGGNNGAQESGEPDGKRRKLDDSLARPGPPQNMPAVPLPMPPFGMPPGMPPFPMPFMPFPIPNFQKEEPKK